MIDVVRTITRKRVAVVLALLVAWSLLWSNGAVAQAANDDEDNSTGTVYSLTNATTGNAVAAFEQSTSGKLALRAYFFTGGNGTGAGLGSQGALALDKNWLFAVNAGSDSISAFKIGNYGLRLTDTIASGGKLPISLTAHDSIIYVLNAGDAGNISGFRLSDEGKFSPIANSTRPLSGAGVGPAQVSFSPNGQLLAVTEKGTNRIDTYVVGENGRAVGPKVFAAAGVTPFGFSFDGNHRLLVSEAFGGAANGSAASSYQVSEAGDLKVVSASIPTHQTAACWLVVSKDGQYTYTANPTSNSLTGFSVAKNGALTPLNADGRTAIMPAGSAPQDVTISKDGRFLYVLDVRVGKVAGFAIAATGQLTALEDAGTLPLGSVGLVAR